MIAAYVMGLAFAFGWTPCIGPVLGPILTLAGGRETVGEGALLLAAYSLGLGIPFLDRRAVFRRLHALPAALPRPSRPGRKGHRRAARASPGVLFLTGGVQTASYWLLEIFPVLGRLG